MSVNDPKHPGGLKSFELEAEKLVENAIKGLEYEVRRWPALVAPLLAGTGLAILSEHLTISPTWLWLVIIGGLIVAAVIARLKGYH